MLYCTVRRSSGAGCIPGGVNASPILFIFLHSIFSLAQVVQIMMATAIFLTYPLQCYVAVDILWTTYLSPRVDNKKYRVASEFGIRIGIVLLTCECYEIIYWQM